MGPGPISRLPNPRPHHDLDIEVLRRDQAALRRAVPGWDLWVAQAGELRPWEPGEWLFEEVFVWARPDRAAPWAIEVILALADKDHWIYRRNPTIRRPLAGFGRRSPDGLPYLDPEVQLLAKSKDIRSKDQADFESVVPLLDDEQRCWLHDALVATYSAHPWLARLYPADPNNP